VLAVNVQVTHIDERQWIAGWRLLTPPSWHQPLRIALAITSGSPPQLEKLVMMGNGSRHDEEPMPLEHPPFPGVAPAALRRWRDELGADAVVVIDRDLLATLSKEIESKLRLSQDMVEQGLVAWRAARAHLGRGLWTEPRVLELLPAPTFDAVQRTFDLLIPDDTAIAAYVVDPAAGELHTSLLAVKRRSDIAVVSTHRAIADLVSADHLMADWRQHYRQVNAAVARRLAPPSLGIFVERAALLRILGGPGDQLGRELMNRTLIFDPAPAWLMGLLGGASALAAASRGANALAAMLSPLARQRVAGLAQRAQSAMRDSGAHPFALLGFDPLELWAELRQYYRPAPPSRR
jgi:hypothetical protein